MLKIFRVGQADEVFAATSPVALDEGESFVSLALRSVVGIVAAATAATSLNAQLPLDSRNQPDEVPTVVVQTVDEDYPASIAAPWKSVRAPIAFTADDEIVTAVVTFGGQEEDWQPPRPWQLAKVSLILGAEDDFAELFLCGHILTEASDRIATESSNQLVTEACPAGASLAVDENEEFNPPARQPTLPIRAFTADDEIPTAAAATVVEEDGQFSFVVQKQQPVRAFSADDEIATTVTTVVEEDGQFSFIIWQRRTVQSFVADDEIVPQPVGAVVEDEGWSVALPGPVVYKQLWLFDPSEVSGTLGTAPPEEDFWAVNKGQPFPSPTIAKTDDDLWIQFVPPPVLAEEEYWWIGKPWILKNPIVAVTDDDVISLPIVFQGSPDEDYPLPVIQPFPRITYHQPITADDEIVNPLHAEDEGYRPPMPWKIPPRQAFRYDDEIVKPLRVDESDWLPPAPWKIRQSPFVINRLEWGQNGIELPAGLVTIDDPCVRQYQADYDTATDVEVESSIIKRPDTISLPYTTAFTIGSNIIGDASGGVLQRAWKVRDGIGTVYVARANDAGNGWEPEFALFTYTGAAITELDFAFEQAGRPVVVAERPTGPSGTGEIWIYWFKPSLGDFIFEKFDAGRTPRCALDNPLDTTNSDVMVFYIKGNNLVYRVQREDYGIVNSTPIVTAANMFVEEVYRGEGRLVVVLSVRDVSTGTYSLLLLESTLYPVIIDNDKMQSNAALLGGELHDTIITRTLADEEYQAGAAIQSGTLIVPILLITLFDTDEYKANAVIQSGTLVVVIILHTLFDVDEYKANAAIQSGTLVVIVISHTLFDVDEYKANALIQSGTLV